MRPVLYDEARTASMPSAAKHSATAASVPAHAPAVRSSAVARRTVQLPATRRPARPSKLRGAPGAA